MVLSTTDFTQPLVKRASPDNRQLHWNTCTRQFAEAKPLDGTRKRTKAQAGTSVESQAMPHPIYIALLDHGSRTSSGTASETRLLFRYPRDLLATSGTPRKNGFAVEVVDLRHSHSRKPNPRTPCSGRPRVREIPDRSNTAASR